MRPTFADHDLDAELVFDRLLTWDDLIRVQSVLVDMAPRWCRPLRWSRSSRDQVLIDVSEPDALASVVVAGAGQRGATYWSLVEVHGRQPFERYVGSVELRGAGPELGAVISLDELVVSPLGQKLALRNAVTLQVRRSSVDGRPGRDWTADCFSALATELSPAWGSARHPAEYWSKVMDDGPRVEAVGRDFGRWLPGAFWLNYFGVAYRELIGEQLLLSAPGARSMGDGVMVGIGDDPVGWADPDMVDLDRRVREHLGTDLFFSRSEPDHVGRVPDWDGEK